MQCSNTFRSITLVLLLIQCSSSSGICQVDGSANSGRFAKWFFTDWIELASSIGPNEVSLGGVFAGGVVLSTIADESMQMHLSDVNSGLFNNYLNLTNTFGSTKALPLVASGFVVSLATSNTKAQDVTFTSMQSILYAGAIWTSLKYVIGRQRPEDGAGPNEFSFFTHEHNSLPSGHSGTAFAGITPLVQYIEHPSSRLLYFIPIGTTLARQKLDKHWLSDTIVGGLIGYLTGRSLSNLHKSSSEGAIFSTDIGTSMIGGQLVPSMVIHF